MADKSPLLGDLRVVELGTVVFAPAACTIMADFGAEVIKMEPPGQGDANRHLHKLPGMPVSDVPYTFQIDNRNKKSVAVDLKSDAGREIAHRLVATADVFVTNYRIAALSRLGMRYEDLKSINPRLIYALGTGFGEMGDDRDRPGYDSISYWSRTGLESQIYPLDGWLGPMPFGSGDHPSGTSMFGAILLALYQRQKSGQGCKVSTSLLANGVWANGSMLQAKLCNAQFNQKRPREQAHNYTYTHYRTRDNRLIKLSIVNSEKHWKPFCEAIGRPNMADDHRFAEIEARRENMPLLIRMLDETFRSADLDNWTEALEQADIPFSVLATFDEVANDPQMHDNDLFVPLEHPRYGPMRTVNSPIDVEGCEKQPPTAAPELGEHTFTVLRDLGYAGTDIEQLESQGVIEQHDGQFKER